MLKEVYLVRHAKSSWDHSGLSDAERPLNTRGKGTAPILAAIMQKKEMFPTHIYCSSALRTRQTVDIMLETLPFQGDVEILDDLYLAPASDLADLMATFKPGTRSMIVAHNPGMEELVHALGCKTHMATCCLAHAVFSQGQENPQPTWEVKEFIKPPRPAEFG